MTKRKQKQATKKKAGPKRETKRNTRTKTEKAKAKMQLNRVGNKKVKDKKESGKTSQFFVLGAARQGTTSAVIRCETFEQVHWIYTHKVVVPAKRTAAKKYQPDMQRKNIYWDGEVYIEKLKLWKKVKGHPVAAIGIRIDLKLTQTEEPEDDE